MKNVTLGDYNDGDKAKSNYNNVITILNDESKKYVNTAYAKNDDSGRCIGTDPLNPDDTITDTQTLQFTWNDSKDSGMKVGDEIYLIDYNAMKKATHQSANGINSISKNYWMPSRTVSSQSYFAQFFVYFVGGNGNMNGAELVRIREGDATVGKTAYEYGLRPVILLTSGIQTNEGDGSESKPFKLLAK